MSEKHTAIAVITGSIQEKVSAFQQIGSAAAAGMYPSGYDSVQKVVAACWAADALGVHPLAYMQGVYVAHMNGRIMLEPKWEFMNALLRGRLPGYKLTVVEETPERATVTMTDGKDTQTVTYTLEDARRQGFMSKDTYKVHTREMLFKQAFKRCAERIGGHVLMGLPALWFEEDGTTQALPPRVSGSSAAVLDENPDAGEPAVVLPRQPEAHGATAAPASEIERPAVMEIPTVANAPEAALRLSTVLKQVFGPKLGKAKLIEKAAIVYAEMNDGEILPWKRADEIGPVVMEQISDFLEKKYDLSGGGNGESVAGPGAQPAEALEAELTTAPESRESGSANSSESAHSTEAAPSVISVGEEPPPVEDEIPYGDEPISKIPPPPEMTYESFMETVLKARAKFSTKEKPRNFVKEAPLGSGRAYYVDSSTLGGMSAVKLSEPGPEGQVVLVTKEWMTDMSLRLRSLLEGAR